MARDQRPPDHEVFVNWMMLYVFKTWNPMIAEPWILADGDMAADYRALLQLRLRGATDLPRLAGAAMESAVTNFPVR